MIEQELRSLDVAFPPSPELEARVLARIERRSRAWLVPVLAVVAAAAALLAIPQTRAAILDFFRIGGVTVERVQTQPRAPATTPSFGEPVTFAEARDAVDFELVVPPPPFTTYFDDPILTMEWDRYALSQWRGQQLPFVQKQVGPQSTVLPTQVHGANGTWITGARHEVIWQVPNRSRIEFRERRLAGSVLIWERAGTTYRLEGARTVEEALELARNLRRP